MTEAYRNPNAPLDDRVGVHRTRSGSTIARSDT